MEIGRSLSFVINALNGFVYVDGFVREGNILHLKPAKLADPNAGEQCNQNARCFPV